MDRALIAQKLESLRRSLQRVKEKCPDDLETLAKDYDAQDIITLNLSRAIQLCVNIGAHLLAETELPAPNTMGEVFESLSTIGVIDNELAELMKKAVGFRNIAVHNYETINWAIVHAIARNRLQDFEAFAIAVIKFTNPESD